MILPPKAKLAAAAALAIAMAALLIWGLYWRGEYREAKAALTVYAAQAAVNKEAVDRCNAGATEAARVGNAAIASMGPLLEAARRARADLDRGAKALDELARRPRAAGENCDWAWDQVEQQHRKARAAP
jgi:hypothetical protein